MFTHYFQGAFATVDFSVLIEHLSRAMRFVAPADAGPWLYK